jgi:uncharacterized repeat protein (TIGR01451 family)
MVRTGIDLDMMPPGERSIKVKVYRTIWVRRPAAPRDAAALLASMSVLLFTAVLALLLFHLQALAQPTAEITALQVEKSVSASTAAPGDILEYTIRIQESGTEHSFLWMTDTIPSEVIYVPGSLEQFGLGTIGYANNVITWTASNFGFGNYAIITFSVQIPYTSTVTEVENTAYITGTGELMTASAKTALASPLDNEGTYKAVDQEMVGPGDLLTYTIVLNNESSFSDVTAYVIDPLHPMLEYVDGSAQIIPSGGGTLVFSQGITWTVDITHGTAVTLVFQARVSDSAPDGEIVNTINVDDGSTPFDRSATVTVNQPPTSITTYPEKWALFTQDSGTVIIKGVAWNSTMWDEDHGPDFPPDPVLDPIDNADGDGRYYVTWSEVPSALSYVLQESENPYFSGEPTEYHEFQEYQGKFFIDIYGKSPGTYYYRVLASNIVAARDSRWSDVESVVVQTAQAFAFSVVPDVSPASSPSPSAELATSDAITVWVRIGDTTPWEVVPLTSAPWGGWEWSYPWILPEEVYDEYVIQTRAGDATGNIGDTDTITVVVHNKEFLMHLPMAFLRWPPLPYKATLNAIDNADEDGDYTVSWSYDYTNIPASSYTLQESKDDASFTNPTNYSTSSKSYPFTDKSDGTYYYRVRAVNQYGSGEWSNVASAKVARSYRDDFETQTTWKWVRGDDIIKKSSSFRIDYRDGNMYVLIVGSYDFGVVSPRVEAPAVPYTLRGKVKVVKDETLDGRTYYIRNGSQFGLVFGANPGSPCPADRSADSDEGCFNHYYRLLVTYDVHNLETPTWQLKRIDSHEEEGKGRGPKLLEGRGSFDVEEWITWKVVVSTSDIKIYVDNEYLDKTTDTKYINDPYFGIFLASPDIGDTGVKWDWYEVER